MKEEVEVVKSRIQPFSLKIKSCVDFSLAFLDLKVGNGSSVIRGRESPFVSFAPFTDTFLLNS